MFNGLSCLGSVTRGQPCVLPMLRHDLAPYNASMTVTLRQARERLSELVERAYQGEDILITVRGKVRARLTHILPDITASDRHTWGEELRQLHADVGNSTQRLRSEDILAKDRAQ